MKNEIVIYNHESSSERIEVRVDEENETFWLTQAQIARLFSRDRTVISKHLKQIFNQKELDENVVCAFFAHTTPHGAISGKSQENRVKYYNLDAILSVAHARGGIPQRRPHINERFPQGVGHNIVGSQNARCEIFGNSSCARHDTPLIDLGKGAHAE